MTQTKGMTRDEMLARLTEWTRRSIDMKIHPDKGVSPGHKEMIENKIRVLQDALYPVLPARKI